MPETVVRPVVFWCFSMRPLHPSPSRPDLFHERLDAVINLRHPLARLSTVMDWTHFDEAFGRLFRPLGRPAKPTRLMVGLHYLKHVHDLSDEEVVARWVENPYWQFFCGFERNLIVHGAWNMADDRPWVVWHKFLEDDESVIGEFFDPWRFERFMKKGEHLLNTLRQFHDMLEEQTGKRIRPR